MAKIELASRLMDSVTCLSILEKGKKVLKNPHSESLGCDYRWLVFTRIEMEQKNTFRNNKCSSQKCTALNGDAK